MSTRKSCCDKAQYKVKNNVHWVPAKQQAQKDTIAPKQPIPAFLSFSNSKCAMVKQQNTGCGKNFYFTILIIFHFFIFSFFKSFSIFFINFYIFLITFYYFFIFFTFHIIILLLFIDISF